MVGLLILITLVLILLNIPVVFSLGMATLLYAFVKGIPLVVVSQKMVSAVDSFPLLAVFFFMLAGNLMNSSGITERMMRFANSMVGHIPGGLGHVNVVSGMIMAGISGSAIADAAAIGSIQINSMKKEGFDSGFSAAITAASSTIGPIIPPSVQMIIFGLLTETSVGALFLGGVIPGVLMGVSLMLYVYFVAKKRNYPRHQRVAFRELLVSAISAFFPLMTPIIILGGIVGGIFTPTEAAVIAVVYAIILGFFAYRELKPSDIPKIIIETVESTGTVLGVLATASALTWVLTVENVPSFLASSFLSITQSPMVMLLIVNIFLLILGCFIEPTAAQILATPIIFPILMQLGVSPVHLGVIVVLNLMIGLLTPPVGLCLYVVSDIAEIPFAELVKNILPILIPLFIVLVIVTYVPCVVTWLPNLFGMGY